ncbi:MAG TPA: iron-containing alcohol dehydrogenase [Spirochaetia bacterium]|nr:iron-containing alcohol dehydrogenase [Spirochaetia bacterium]
MNISKFVSPEIIFGRGALSQIGDSALRIGANKVFVVSDEGVINAGWVDRALGHLKAAGLGYEVFADLTSNPKDNEVASGLAKYQASGCDVLMSVGGSSPTDVTKAIAMLATNGGSIHDYEGVNKVTRPLPPMIAVPSTGGSGSEVSQFAIIVDRNRKLKMAIISKSLVPDIAIIDPEVLQTKSARLTAATGMDALCHAIEAFVSLAATPLTDIHALNAIRLITGNLRESVACRTNMEAKVNMAMASINAAMAFSNAILGAAHALTHQVDGLLDTHHGETNASVLPYVMEFNLIACPGKFQVIAEAMGENVTGMSPRHAAEKAVEAVRRLTADVGLVRGLREVGLAEESIPRLCKNAMNDACLITNPRDADENDLAGIYLRAM